MSILRAAIGVGGGALLALILWAAFAGQDLHGGFFTQVDVITALPWGIVTLADLYLGFALFAALVFVVEKSLLRAVLWAAPVFFLGNVWAALWFVLRLPELARRISVSPAPPQGSP
ncbi:MAG: hypothetical protein NW203_10745 [Hyphomonadaceae bacterium]|nr:hypothetical protein [Hyphomonadaceae bacterium]